MHVEQQTGDLVALPRARKASAESKASTVKPAARNSRFSPVRTDASSSTT
jgi:hypothetical protein